MLDEGAVSVVDAERRDTLRCVFSADWKCCEWYGGADGEVELEGEMEEVVAWLVVGWPFGVEWGEYWMGLLWI